MGGEQMTISEAIKARTEEKPYITRKAWNIKIFDCRAVELKIMPTDTPECCIITSRVAISPRRGWQPQLEDLIADDWGVTD